jgi:hypothetical protein
MEQKTHWRIQVSDSIAPFWRCKEISINGEDFVMLASLHEEAFCDCNDLFYSNIKEIRVSRISERTQKDGHILIMKSPV